MLIAIRHSKQVVPHLKPIHYYKQILTTLFVIVKAIPLQAWTGPEVSRRLKLPDFKTIGT